jgi:hypothetical protein
MRSEERELTIKERFIMAKFQWPPSGLPNRGMARLEELQIPNTEIKTIDKDKTILTYEYRTKTD